MEYQRFCEPEATDELLKIDLRQSYGFFLGELHGCSFLADLRFARIVIAVAIPAIAKTEIVTVTVTVRECSGNVYPCT